MANEKYLGSERVSEFWLAIKTTITTKIADALKGYVTDDGVITAITIALEDYAKTDDVNEMLEETLRNYMTSSEVNQAILDAVKEITGISFEEVDVLPEIGKSNVIYLVPNTDPDEKNIKDEYIYINGKYEKIGSTSVNLSNYWSKDELQAMSSAELQEILK